MHRRWATWGPFALFLLAGAVRWILADAHPETESSAGSQALGYTLAALAWMALLLRPQAPQVREKAGLHRAAFASLGGALAFCGPTVWEFLRASRVRPSGLMVAFALTPVVVALASRMEAVAGRIWPGLAAVAGLLLVVSPPSLTDMRSDVALALAPVITGCGAALLCSDDARGRWWAPCALAGAALAIALNPNAPWWHAGMVWPSLWAIGWDSVTALLSLWVLLRMGALRWSAQFVLLPLLLLLEAILLMRATLMLRELFGLLLMALAGVYLLVPQPDGAEAPPAVTPR